MAKKRDFQAQKWPKMENFEEDFDACTSFKLLSSEIA